MRDGCNRNVAQDDYYKDFVCKLRLRAQRLGSVLLVLRVHSPPTAAETTAYAKLTRAMRRMITLKVTVRCRCEAHAQRRLLLPLLLQRLASGCGIYSSALRHVALLAVTVTTCWCMQFLHAANGHADSILRRRRVLDVRDAP